MKAIVTLWNCYVPQKRYKEQNLSPDEVQGILDRHINKEVNWDSIEMIVLLGLDEISRRKGHKDFVTIVTARFNGETIILAILKI